MSSSSREYYFVMVGSNDQPLFEMDFPPRAGSAVSDQRHLNQFIAHAALDIVDEHARTSNAMYFKNIDKFNEWLVSAFTPAATRRARFLCLHTHRNDDGIRQFFQEMYETWVKLSMNPFHEADAPIRSAAFEQKALYYGRKYLT